MAKYGRPFVVPDYLEVLVGLVKPVKPKENPDEAEA
jgi:hypothetical protein